MLPLLMFRMYVIFILAQYHTPFMTKISFCSRYSLIETIDGKYGAKDKITGEWNGMVGMIVRRVGLTVISFCYYIDILSRLLCKYMIKSHEMDSLGGCVCNSGGHITTYYTNYF